MPRKISATASAGLSSGIITRRAICTVEAPSMRAASITSAGMPSTAANRIRNTNGTQCQMSTATTDASAMLVEPE